MQLISPLIFLLLLASIGACQQKNCTQSYPEFISKNGLQESYEQAKLDWYLLNATDSYSKSNYLVVYDSNFDLGTTICDEDRGHWVSDHQLLEDKEKMLTKFGPDRILEFVATDIDLFEYDVENIVKGDTLTLTFFPEDNERGQIIDPTDGAIHTLIYVNGVLKTVGQNDYIEFDVDAEKVEQELTILKEKVRQATTVTEWLKCQLLK